MRSACVAVLLSLGLLGCVHTSELPLAPNVVRLDTTASGALFVGTAADKTLQRAAEITLAKGYTHFRLADAATSQGRELSGVMVNTSGSVYGSSGFGSYSGFSTATPVYRSTESVGVTVVMFKAGEPGAKTAFDAAEVLAEQKKKT